MFIDYRKVEWFARVQMALLFLISAFEKVTTSSATQAYMGMFGVPGVLLWPAALWEFTAGLGLIFRWLPRLLPIGLAGWCVLTAVIFHRAWGDSVQQMHFFKNMTMCGAFLMIALAGPFGREAQPVPHA